jgi:hypothetical protein
MARLIVHLQRPPQGGSALIHVALTSDEDATPREHEQQHRRIVQRLLPGLDLDDPGPNVEVERVRPAQDPMICASGDDGGYEVIDLG